MLMGLIAQGMALFNKFSWHDDIHSLFLTGETISSGRWMLHVVSQIEIVLFGDGHFSLPLMNGLFSLLCIGFASGLIVRLLRIRSRCLCALLGGVMTAFPMVTALFGFMFAAPYYMLALLMMVAGAVLICEPGAWWKKGTGAVLCGCSVGIYQAFLPLLLSLILLYDISVLQKQTKPFSLGKMLLIQAGFVAAAMVVYVAGSLLFQALYDTQLSSYMGINQAASLSLGTYLERAARAYREFFLPSRYTLWDMYPQHMHYLYLGMLFAEAVLSMLLLINTWRRDRGQALVLFLLLALFPLGCNFIFVMSEEVHSLMVYGQVAQFFLLVWLVDQAEIPHLKAKKAVRSLAALALSLACVMYARYDNQCYLKAAFQQQEAISWNTELITQIKSTPGYTDELPVAWVNRQHIQDKSVYNIDELGFLSLSTYDVDTRTYISSWAWEEFMKRWCGFGPEIMDEDEVKDWPEVQAMPAYPADGSIQLIHDIVVVKF